MYKPPMDIERVVREVLAELGVAPKPETAPAAAKPGPQQAASTPADGQLMLCGRTISLADLPERLEGVRRVVVATGAVVTPSVRDELTRRAISLVRADPQSTAVERPPVLMVSMDSPLDPVLIAQAFQTEGYAVESRHGDCLIRASEELAKGVAGGRALGVLLTRHAAAAMCLANRQAGVRAIRGTTPEAVSTDAGAVGANVLIVDTSAVGFFPARQMIGRFLRGGVRECPEVFRKQLSVVS
jgi:hypothetical protein